jgi:Ni/Co efflux regulator RcnB
MKTKLIASALLAMTIAASGSAMAQRGNDHNDRNDRNDHGQQHDNDGRNDDARKFKRDNSRGGGPNHDLRRGQKLNQEYRDNRYVVSDWKNRHLSAPPRGQHWVRAGNDYVLAAVATGVITQILLSN